MLHREEIPFIDIVILAFIMVLALTIGFLPGCAQRQPNAMTIDERLEPYRYLIKDTLFRDGEVNIFVGEDYYNLNNKLRMDFAQNLSWSFYPREVVIKDVSNNHLLMSISEDRHIQVIWQQGIQGDEQWQKENLKSLE